MKIKFLLTVIVFLTFFLSPEAQVFNSGNKIPDSLDMFVFRQLVNFLADKTPVLIDQEKAADSLRHIGEQHMLVKPIVTFPGSEGSMATRFSYDNFLPTVYNKEGLQGSPFLLAAYTLGLVANQLDSIIRKTDYLYNYDKVSGNLLLKRGTEAPIGVYKEQVRFFCLKTDSGGYIFEKVTLLNPNEFFQVLFRGSKYSAYKLIKSQFINANQRTNGYQREGNDYDEYRDFYTYYLVDPVKKESRVFELSKKSLRKTLSSESAIVEQYIKDHSYEPVTEPYVTGLFQKLNQ
jgi:hypothetical protein